MTIVIENKVWAGDQDDQISKYLRWLNSESAFVPLSFLIYLTPTGRAPRELVSDSAQLKLLSYAEIADWLARESLPDGLGNVVVMYSEICRRIAGGYVKTSYSDEVAQLLSSPIEFEVALGIAEFVEVQRPLVVARFWENVRGLLDTRLTDAGFSDRWATVLSQEVTDKGSWIAVMPKRSKADSGAAALSYKPRYAVSAECDAKAQWYGISRPPGKRSEELVALDSETSEGLLRLGFKKGHSWWCGWQYLSDAGLVGKSRSQKDWIVLLNTDNQNPTTPHAVQIASGMWELFVRFREPIDALNALAL
jgi:hypothetical protein